MSARATQLTHVTQSVAACVPPNWSWRLVTKPVGAVVQRLTTVRRSWQRLSSSSMLRIGNAVDRQHVRIATCLWVFYEPRVPAVHLTAVGRRSTPNRHLVTASRAASTRNSINSTAVQAEMPMNRPSMPPMSANSRSHCHEHDKRVADERIKSLVSRFDHSTNNWKQV